MKGKAMRKLKGILILAALFLLAGGVKAQTVSPPVATPHGLYSV